MHFTLTLNDIINCVAESENGIFNAILRGHVDFTSDPWPSISSGAKDLVKKMLTSDPKQRLTAVQVLSKYEKSIIGTNLITLASDLYQGSFFCSMVSGFCTILNPTR